jgi:hypothetical protein
MVNDAQHRHFPPVLGQTFVPNPIKLPKVRGVFFYVDRHAEDNRQTAAFL